MKQEIAKIKTDTDIDENEKNFLISIFDFYIDADL
jgi:hypothetical protein